MKDIEGFLKVVHKGKGGKRGPKKHQIEGQQTNLNKFQVLEEEVEITKEDQVMEGSPMEKEKEEYKVQTWDINKQKETMLSDVEQDMDQEMTQIWKGSSNRGP